MGKITWPVTHDNLPMLLFLIVGKKKKASVCKPELLGPETSGRYSWGTAEQSPPPPQTSFCPPELTGPGKYL